MAQTLTENVFCAMALNQPYKAKDLIHAAGSLSGVYTALRELVSGGVVDVSKVKPEKGRAYNVYVSKQPSVLGDA